MDGALDEENDDELILSTRWGEPASYTTYEG